MNRHRTPEQRTEELRARYTDPSACAAELLCEAHPADRVAFRFVNPDLSSREVTYGELADLSRRCAAALADHGVGPGDRVATLMGKSLDLVVTLLGIWRLGAVHVPLFTAFAPATVTARLTAAKANVVVCDADQRAKVTSADLWHVITAGPERPWESYEPDDDSRSSPIAVGGEGVLVQLYTSGTTGTAKAVPLPLKALAAIHTYLEYGLDLRDDDIYWNAADTGWGYGLFYGVIGPLVAGRCNLLLRSAFSAELTWRVLARFQVTNFAAAPTVFRALRVSPAPLPIGDALRCLSSAGEPLPPDLSRWAAETLRVPIRDHYGQTEHGMLVVNGWHPDVKRPLKPGSMGLPMPGWEAAVLRPDRDEMAPPGTLGRIVVDVPASPLHWFPGYLDAPEQTAERYSPDGRWYYTGDAGHRDDGGFIYFSARDDDVIIMAGYRIGPTEVENALMAHPDVAEAAVVGVPDELRGEVLAAFVVLRPGRRPSDTLTAELQHRVKRDYAAHAYPREVHYTTELPKGPSGKVQRFLLRRGLGGRRGGRNGWLG